MKSEIDEAQLRQAIREHVLAEFVVDGQEPPADDEDLLASGLIDSLAVMELVSFVEEHCGVTVEDEEIVADNFRSINALTRYVAGKHGIHIPDPFVSGVLELITEGTPPGATVLVLSHGDNALLDAPDRAVCHFPCDETGAYSDSKPADGEDAVRAVERLQRQGATHVIFPRPELWWLDHYRDLREYLAERGQELLRRSSGVVYKLPAGA